MKKQVIILVLALLLTGCTTKKTNNTISMNEIVHKLKIYMEQNHYFEDAIAMSKEALYYDKYADNYRLDKIDYEIYTKGKELIVEIPIFYKNRYYYNKITFYLDQEGKDIHDDLTFFNSYVLDEDGLKKMVMYVNRDVTGSDTIRIISHETENYLPPHLMDTYQRYESGYPPMRSTDGKIFYDNDVSSSSYKEVMNLSENHLFEINRSYMELKDCLDDIEAQIEDIASFLNETIDSKEWVSYKEIEQTNPYSEEVIEDISKYAKENRIFNDFITNNYVADSLINSLGKYKLNISYEYDMLIFRAQSFGGYSGIPDLGTFIIKYDEENGYSYEYQFVTYQRFTYKKIVESFLGTLTEHRYSDKEPEVYLDCYGRYFYTLKYDLEVDAFVDNDINSLEYNEVLNLNGDLKKNLAVAYPALQNASNNFEKKLVKLGEYAMMVLNRETK